MKALENNAVIILFTRYTQDITYARHDFLQSHYLTIMRFHSYVILNLTPYTIWLENIWIFSELSKFKPAILV